MGQSTGDIGVPSEKDYFGNETILRPANLTTFGGKGNYSSPKFIWNVTVAPTAVEFLSSKKLGEQYQNEMFVGDYVNGYLYHFELNQDRTGMELSTPLSDGIANRSTELEDIIFGKTSNKDLTVICTSFHMTMDRYIELAGEYSRVARSIDGCLH